MLLRGLWCVFAECFKKLELHNNKYKVLFSFFLFFKFIYLFLVVCFCLGGISFWWLELTIRITVVLVWFAGEGVGGGGEGVIVIYIQNEQLYWCAIPECENVYVQYIKTDFKHVLYAIELRSECLVIMTFRNSNRYTSIISDTFGEPLRRLSVEVSGMFTKTKVREDIHNQNV